MNLQQSNWFRTYDLLPLQYEDALKYLRNLQHVESELAIELAGDRAPARRGNDKASPLDAESLRRLFDRYGNHPDSLISTPLLMHFVSQIGIERAAMAESLAQLYAEVVKDYLKHDYGDPEGKVTTPYRGIVQESGLMNAEGPTTIKVAMARVALAILAGGNTRLHRDGTSAEIVLDRMLADPNKFRHPKEKDWWPSDSWWHESRYFQDSDKDEDGVKGKGKLNSKARRAIQEFSFLRRDGDKIGFLHDSFLYYFAALAVRCKEDPDIDLCPLSASAKGF